MSARNFGWASAFRLVQRGGDGKVKGRRRSDPFSLMQRSWGSCEGPVEKAAQSERNFKVLASRTSGGNSANI